MFGSIVALVMFAGVICWLGDNFNSFVKWFCYILFSPILLPCYLFGFVVGIVKSFKDKTATDSIDGLEVSE